MFRNRRSLQLPTAPVGQGSMRGVLKMSAFSRLGDTNKPAAVSAKPFCRRAKLLAAVHGAGSKPFSSPQFSVIQKRTC